MIATQMFPKEHLLGKMQQYPGKMEVISSYLFKIGKYLSLFFPVQSHCWIAGAVVL